MLRDVNRIRCRSNLLAEVFAAIGCGFALFLMVFVGVALIQRLEILEIVAEYSALIWAALSLASYPLVRGRVSGWE